MTDQERMIYKTTRETGIKPSNPEDMVVYAPGAFRPGDQILISGVKNANGNLIEPFTAICTKTMMWLCEECALSIGGSDGQMLGATGHRGNCSRCKQRRDLFTCWDWSLSSVGEPREGVDDE